MALTEEQRELRKQYIGSSDASAIMGLNPFQSAADVWLIKTGQISGDVESDVMRMGTLLEPAVLNWLEEEIERPIERDIMYIHSQNNIMAANLDGLVREGGPPMIAEAKTAGLIAPPSYITEFGEEDTDELPEWILAQCHHQLAVVRSQPGLENTKVVLVPALIIRRGFVLYRIEYSEAWERQLIETETRFWNEYVLKNERPPDSVPHLDNLKQLSRQPNKIVDIDPRLVARWDKCRLARLETLKRLKAAEEHAAAEVVMALDDAEGGVFSGDDGPGMVTFFEYHRRGYPVKPTSYRSLKLKGVK